MCGLASDVWICSRENDAHDTNFLYWDYLSLGNIKLQLHLVKKLQNPNNVIAIFVQTIFIWYQSSSTIFYVSWYHFEDWKPIWESSSIWF